MLTDEEIQDIRNRAKLNDNRQIDPMAFAREIERAVLAKAGEQQVIGRVHYVDDRIYGCLNSIGRRLADGAPLYAHPLPAQAIPEGYQLAPMEPTESMLDAGVAMALQVSVHGEGGWSKYLRGLYKQMLSASPKP